MISYVILSTFLLLLSCWGSLDQELLGSIIMGAICCCPCGDEFEEYPSNSIYRHCVCLRFFFHQLLSGYGAMFHRIEGRPVVSSIHGTTLTSTEIGIALPDTSLTDANHSVSRPLSYDADQRFSRSQRDGLVLRREKSLSHLQEDSLPPRRNASTSGMDTLGSGKKWCGVDSTEDFKRCHSELLEKESATKAAHGLVYQHASDDDDVCPTCLDEYTSENPKIVTQCSHHFHLGCIYEWMERSDNCPMCGKEMVFCESP